MSSVYPYPGHRRMGIPTSASSPGLPKNSSMFKNNGIVNKDITEFGLFDITDNEGNVKLDQPTRCIRFASAAAHLDSVLSPRRAPASSTLVKRPSTGLDNSSNISSTSQNNSTDIPDPMVERSPFLETEPVTPSTTKKSSVFSAGPSVKELVKLFEAADCADPKEEGSFSGNFRQKSGKGKQVVPHTATKTSSVTAKQAVDTQEKQIKLRSAGDFLNKHVSNGPVIEATKKLKNLASPVTPVRASFQELVNQEGDECAEITRKHSVKRESPYRRHSRLDLQTLIRTIASEPQTQETTNPKAAKANSMPAPTEKDTNTYMRGTATARNLRRFKSKLNFKDRPFFKSARDQAQEGQGGQQDRNTNPAQSPGSREATGRRVPGRENSPQRDANVFQNFIRLLSPRQNHPRQRHETQAQAQTQTQAQIQAQDGAQTKQAQTLNQPQPHDGLESDQSGTTSANTPTGVMGFTQGALQAFRRKGTRRQGSP